MSDEQSQTKKVSEPMDKAAREAGAPQDFTPRPRDAYAVVTLVSEVQSIFPDISVETFNPNGRGVNLSVAFYDDEEPDLATVLALIEDETRIEVVERSTGDESEPGYTVVQFDNNPVSYDRREGFDIAGAIEVLSEDVPPSEALIDPDDDPEEEPRERAINDGVESEQHEPGFSDAADIGIADEDDDVLTEEEDTEPEAKPGHYIWRSAKTGRIVQEAYAKRNPDTTIREWVADSEEDE
jgi:hypothetical protein